MRTRIIFLLALLSLTLVGCKKERGLPRQQGDSSTTQLAQLKGQTAPIDGVNGGSMGVTEQNGKMAIRVQLPAGYTPNPSRGSRAEGDAIDVTLPVAKIRAEPLVFDDGDIYVLFSVEASGPIAPDIERIKAIDLAGYDDEEERRLAEAFKKGGYTGSLLIYGGTAELELYVKVNGRSDYLTASFSFSASDDEVNRWLGYFAGKTLTASSPQDAAAVLIYNAEEAAWKLDIQIPSQGVYKTVRLARIQLQASNVPGADNTAVAYFSVEDGGEVIFPKFIDIPMTPDWAHGQMVLTKPSTEASQSTIEIIIQATYQGKDAQGGVSTGDLPVFSWEGDNV